MGDAKQFKVSLDKFGKDQLKVVGQMMRRGAFLIMGDLVAGSPVDTGRFQASWFVGIGQPNRTVGDERTGKTGAKSESLARLKELTPKSVTGTEPIFLSNNLPYGPALAEGHSDQAPSGWVDAAVTRAKVELGIVQLEVGD